MPLQDFTPTTQRLAPELFGAAAPGDDSRPRTTWLRTAHVRDGVRTTFTLPGDWPANVDEWLMAGGTTYSPHARNAVELYVEGQPVFDAMVEALATATGSGHFIILIGWTCHDDFGMSSSRRRAGDLAGLTFAQILEAKVAAGVEVRAVLYEHATGAALFDELVAWMPEAPVVRATFDRINALGASARCMLDLNHRMPVGCHHQKILLVRGSEGLVGFFGGVDINPDRVTATWSGAPMHDVHARVQGPAAGDLLDLAILRWNMSGMASIDLGRSIDDASRFRTQGEPTGSCNVQIGQTIGNPRIAAVGGQHSDAWDAIAHALAKARRFIYLEDQYFWSEAAARALGNALPLVGHLTILLPPAQLSGTGSDASVLEGGLSGLDLRHAAIAALYEAAGSHSHKIGIFQRASGSQSYIHSKTWIIDDEVAIIGSANCNRRGYLSDSEVCGLVADRKDAPWYELHLGQAHKLRMRLWEKHLGLSGACLEDGVAAAVYWHRSIGHVRTYQVYEAGVVGGVPWRLWAAANPAGEFPGSDVIDPGI